MQLLLDPPIAPNKEIRANYTADTRPDLPDSDLWTKLFQRINVKGFPATDFDFHAFEILRVVRTTGTLLIYSHHSDYTFKPLVDIKNWESIDFFNEMKQKYLTPYLPTFYEWLTLIKHDHG